MRDLSGRSLLISHLAMFIVLCLLIIIGHGAILTVLHVFTGAELSDLHQGLKSDELFQDIESASALSLSAVATGWFAARTSSTKPLIHGALSSAAFSLLFLCGAGYDLFQTPGIDLFRHRPLLRSLRTGIAVIRNHRRVDFTAQSKDAEPGQDIRRKSGVGTGRPSRRLGYRMEVVGAADLVREHCNFRDT